MKKKNIHAYVLSLYINYNAIKDSNYQNMSYASIDEFFQPNLFNEIKKYISIPQNEYNVCSIGLYPSIALYNGFYCLDGYSNNYSLFYKHEFRSIISNELEKNPSLASYFDNWGNRCYIFTNEIGSNYYVNKNSGLEINNLNIDTEKLKSMGCKYIFSTVKINNCTTLKFEKIFSNDNSVYDVYLYNII